MARILIGLGGNLPSPRFGPPRQTLEAALKALAEVGIAPVRRSSWYESDAVPPSDQPPFINAVAQCITDLEPREVLDILHAVEADFGRERRVRWEARVVDLDLIAYDDLVLGDPQGTEKGLIVPHPRMHERRFVLEPLAELAPDWRHPVTGRTARQLLADLKGVERVDKLPELPESS